MATVYAARIVGEASFEKLVALKLMLPHLARDEKFVRMFVDEARLAAQVQSPYVVATLDLGREGDQLFQVLELVLGASMRQLLDAQSERGGPLPIPVALALLTQAARGLADAHAARSMTGQALDLVHRDVSPHNVLVGIDGRARLSDFGVARAAARVGQTESGELKGKLAYASPEQLRGDPVDPRSDVFSLGIVAWEVLVGRRLFEADNPLAIVDKMTRQAIPRVDEMRPEVPASVADAVAAALVRGLDARLPSAAELAARLERGASEVGGLASTAEVAEVVRSLSGSWLADIEQTIVARAQEASMASGRPRRTRWFRGAAALVALTLAGWAVARWTRAADPPGAAVVEEAPSPPVVAAPRGPGPVGVAGAATDTPELVEAPDPEPVPGGEVAEPARAGPAASGMRGRRGTAAASPGMARGSAATSGPSAPLEPLRSLPSGPVPSEPPAARPSLLGLDAFDREGG